MALRWSGGNAASPHRISRSVMFTTVSGGWRGGSSPAPGPGGRYWPSTSP
ncbi:hypothetical protein KCH_42580 [Kitasatospora cheerisanensis KCTC 2395]|uniref:Uncharacterized protein n=1 Tax=Kitasatospora cheerisanensis KCTC 2395 TaxID=1348663 RepID=A0A066YT84_9ACTN|nr:hypothetical protein KCH_42580 [Kitasatospora cheerisanensis KCTC 2395]